jgi:hypothetical protein
MALPAIGATLALSEGSPALASIPLALYGAALLATYFFFNEEVRLELDEQNLSLSRSRLLFGARLTPRLDWQIPLASLTHAKELRTRTPAREGGWKRTAVLQLPEGRTLDARELGGSQDKSSAYNQLVSVLEQRLGAAFERPQRRVE